jgi:hypothetical protein
MHIPATRLAREKFIRSFDEFLRTASPEEFATLEGSGAKTIGDLITFPQSTWIHPALIKEHLLNGARASSARHTIDILANRDDQEAPDAKYYSLMLSLWSIEQGLIQLRLMYDPPVSQTINDRLVATNRKLQLLPPLGGKDETRDRSRSPSQREPQRRNGSQHRDTPNRDAMRRGRDDRHRQDKDHRQRSHRRSPHRGGSQSSRARKKDGLEQVVKSYSTGVQGGCHNLLSWHLSGNVVNGITKDLGMAKAHD